MPNIREVPAAPTGLGLYIRTMPKNVIHSRVQRMFDHGIRWAAIFACWQDVDRYTKEPTLRIINSEDQIKRISEELNNHGIKVHLCGYPWKGRHEQFVEVMQKSSHPDNNIVGWLIDPEKGMKINKKNPEFDEKDEVIDAGIALFWECIKANPYRLIGFTSYGFVKGHPTFPWESFTHKDGFNPLKECDYGSPQLYDEEPRDIERGLSQYQELGVDIIVPSYGTYKFDYDEDGNRTYPKMSYLELKSHLNAFKTLKAKYNIKGMIGWSEMQVSAGGWSAIAEFANAFD